MSRIRNRVIVRVLRELSLVEEWGTGYRRVTQACKEGGYPPPTWHELSSSLRVVFRPHPDVVDNAGESNQASGAVGIPKNETVNDTAETVNDTVNETVNTRQQWFIAQIIAGRQPDWTALTQQWQVSRATARRDIADLKARGLIEFVGAPKTGFYQLASKT